MANELKLILVDPKPELCDAFQEKFKALPNVEIVTGKFENLNAFDCMVSAANSFGLMDGGVDAAIIQFFGYELQERVQTRIVDEFLGEQPVGTSIIVETNHSKHPFIAHTPTMRVPMDIAHTDHVYLAMWAMLLAVRQHNLKSEKKIQIIACPGLGTATGHVPYRQAARQMALAYEHFLNPPSVLDWRFADKDKIKFVMAVIWVSIFRWTWSSININAPNTACTRRVGVCAFPGSLRGLDLVPAKWRSLVPPTRG